MHCCLWQSQYVGLSTASKICKLCWRQRRQRDRRNVHLPHRQWGHTFKCLWRKALLFISSLERPMTRNDDGDVQICHRQWNPYHSTSTLCCLSLGKAWQEGHFCFLRGRSMPSFCTFLTYSVDESAISWAQAKERCEARGPRRNWKKQSLSY